MPLIQASPATSRNPLEAAARILSHRSVVDRDELNPDTITDHFTLAIRALEETAEVSGIALDWETIRIRIAPGPFPHDALVVADAAALP